MEGTALMRRTNLPAESSSFVGRRHELAQVKDAIGAHRLVTLFGPGGVGKTRLAFRAAADLLKGFRDGSWVVELAPVHDAQLVPDTVVAALGLRDSGGGGSSRDRLLQYLRERELLLVLDNCEHVQDSVAILVEDLLGHCPEVRVIATSRHAFGLEGEQLLPVPPLPVPGGARGASSSEGLMHYDSVRLFVDRATASWSEFEVTSANQAALAELVRRLDGVPLAIELASVRVRSLSVQQILDRLADRFALLSRGSRAAMPRQQTLRALIGWSHDLLDQEERLLWERATVFSGSFDTAAVREVACDAEAPPSRAEDLLDSLVSKSILVRETDPGTQVVRFRMLESIKEFGRARLAESGEAERLVEAHRVYFAAMAARAAHEMYGPEGVAWFRRLREDHDNLRAALEHCLGEPERAAEGLGMVAALQHYWVMVGRFGEARHWVDRLMLLCEEACEARAAGLEVAGRLAVLQGDVERGRLLLERALAEATETGSVTWRAHTLHAQALSEMFWGEPVRAVTLLEEALALHRDGTDPFGVPLALVQLATVHATLGDPVRAMGYAEECIAMSEQAGEQWCAALARWTQALVVWRQGRTAKVRSYAREVLRLKEPFGDRMGMAMSMEMVAWVDSLDGRHAQAATLLGSVQSALSSIGGSLFGHLQEDHEACVVRTREALGEAAYREDFEAGASMEFASAVALALGRRRSAGAESAEGEVRLTRRESEIAALVARGLTNREIAQELVMSQRTAEGHVARILNKLGFTSRGQLSAWVADQAD